MAEQPSPELSVIVPAHGRPDALEAMLASVAAQTLARDRFEVIVVDDGSDPPLADGLPPGALAGVQLIRQSQGGPGKARNTALEVARGWLVHFVNADAVLAPDSLERHLAAHTRGGPPKAIMGRFDWLPQHRSAFIELSDRVGLLFPYVRATPGVPLGFEFFWTGNLSVPAAAVRAVDGFDADGFRRAVFDDVEFGYRLLRSGVDLIFDPGNRCGHDHAMTLDTFLRWAEWLGHQWVNFADRHGPTPFRILGTAQAPDMAMASTLLAALLDQEDAHGLRVHEARELLASLDRELANAQGPTQRDAIISAAVEAFGPASEGVMTVAVMRGVAGGILGYTPDEAAAHRERVRRVAGVHTITEASDVRATWRLLETLPVGAELIVTHSEWLPSDALPRDPRVKILRTADDLPPEERYRPILDATRAGSFVFLDGRRLPAPAEWRALSRFLGVSPRVSVIGLGAGCGRPEASARLTQRVPSAVVTMSREVLEGYRPQHGTLLASAAARDHLFATLSPAGA